MADAIESKGTSMTHIEKMKKRWLEGDQKRADACFEKQI
jgi:hypothetical protein